MNYGSQGPCELDGGMRKRQTWYVCSMSTTKGGNELNNGHYAGKWISTDLVVYTTSQKRNRKEWDSTLRVFYGNVGCG